MLTFADLITAETPAAIRARIVAALAADGFPVDSWAPSAVGGVENMRVDMSAGIGIYMPPRIVSLVTGRILPLATGDFLKTLGKKFYGLDQQGPTSTIQNMAFFLKPGAAPVNYSFQAGQIKVRSDATGNRYTLIDSGNFTPANATFATALMLRVQADAPGKAYADPVGTVTTMVTAKAGVQCTNVEPTDFQPTPASLRGTSSGTVVATRFPAEVAAPQSIRVRILSTGSVGSASFEFTFDGGLTWHFGGPTSASVPVSTAVPQQAAVLAFAGSFVVGDVFSTFLGKAIQQQGADAETESAFRRRCSNRWPALSAVPTAGSIDLLAHLASPEVDRVSTDADPNTSGGILVTIASAVGPATPGAQEAVQDYIAQRLAGYQAVPAPATAGFTSPAETVLVTSAVEFSVTAAGPVRVPKAQLAAAQVAANDAWASYLADLPLGGQAGAVVELAELAQILADSGAIDVPSALANLTINGVSGDATIPKGQVAVAPLPLQDTLIWIPA
jgi:hypothetical protein